MTKQEYIEALELAVEQENTTMLNHLLEQARTTYAEEEEFILYYEAVHQLQIWSFQKAVDILQGLLQKDADNIAYSLALAKAYTGLGAVESALATYTGLTHRVDDLSKVYLPKAELYLGKTDWESARLHIERLHQQQKPTVKSLLLSAQIHQKTNQFHQALEELTKAVEKDAHQAAIYSMRISILKTLDRVDEVIADYQMLIRLRGRGTQLLEELAAYLMEQKRLKDSAAAWTAAIDVANSKQLSPVNAYLGRAGLYLQEEIYKDAYEDIQQVLKLEDHPKAYALFAKLCLSFDRFSAAIQHITKAIELKANNAWDYYIERAQYYVKEENYPAAKQDLKHCLKHPVYKMHAYYELGNLAVQQGDLEEATDAFEQASALGHQEAKHALLQHCQPVVEARAKAIQQAMEQRYSRYFKDNAQAEILQRLQQSVWGFDQEATLAANKRALMTMDAERKAILLEIFSALNILISEQVFCMLSSVQKDVISYYKIASRQQDKVVLIVQHRPDQASKQIELTISGEDSLVIGGWTAGALSIHFKASSIEKGSQLSDKVKQLEERKLGVFKVNKQ